MILLDSAHLSFATDSLVLAEVFPMLNVPEVVGRWDDLSNARTEIHTIIFAFFNTYVAEDNSPQMRDLIFEGSDVTIFNDE